MTPHKQILRHDPPNTYGDCERTAIAAVLDLRPEDVPNFMHMEREDEPVEVALKRRNDWLATRGIVPITMVYNGEATLPAILEQSIALNPGVPFLIHGLSPRGPFGHTVAALDGRIACDPATGESPARPELALAGPMPSDGLWWVTFFGRLLDGRLHDGVPA